MDAKPPSEVIHGCATLVGRYYDPAAAQLLSVDSMVATTGRAYGFIGDDPLISTDPR